MFFVHQQYTRIASILYDENWETPHYRGNGLKNVLSILLWTRTIGIFVLGGLLYLACAFFVSPQQIHPYARNICRWLLWGIGQKIHVHGEWPTIQSPRIYMFNHTSLLDTFICIATIPEHTATIGKKEQFAIPIWGSILRHWGCIALDRYHPQRAIQQLNTLQLQFSGNKALLVAPEGTRSPTGKLLSLKKGPFYIAESCSASIVPIGIQGAFESKNKNSWQVQAGVVHVYIGDLIPPQGRETLRAKTYKALQELSTRESMS